MGFGLAVMKYLYVVVPQAIILCWAAAQKWTQPFDTYFPLYWGWLRPFVPNFIKIGQETEKLWPFLISDKIEDLYEKMN